MKEFKLYRNEDTGKILFETWGGSTHHPDARFHYEEFKRNDFQDEEDNLFQFIVECASRMTWRQHTESMLKWLMYEGKEEIMNMVKGA